MVLKRRMCVFSFAAIALACATAVVGGCGSSDSGKKTKFVAIGTGGVTGVYYPTGGAIAKLVNKKRDVYGIKMSVESTGGSLFNINAVMGGDLQFGIAQSDRQYQAYNGIAEWQAAGPQRNLRAVCSLYTEMVTLVAADDSGIETLSDLSGKRVNIGNAGSGTRGNALAVIGAAGLDWKKDVRTESLKADESASMLQDGRIDAFFYTVGHPNGSIKEATAGLRRSVHFVPVTGMDELIERSPYYVKTAIPIELYPKSSNKENVPTIGMSTTLVTSAVVPDDVVYAITKELFENLESFRKTHPALEGLTKEFALEGLSAPIHPGALKYYREVGLMK